MKLSKISNRGYKKKSKIIRLGTILDIPDKKIFKKSFVSSKVSNSGIFFFNIIVNINFCISFLVFFFFTYLVFGDDLVIFPYNFVANYLIVFLLMETVELYGPQDVYQFLGFQKDSICIRFILMLFSKHKVKKK